jgi:hypothetical protein
MAPRAAPTTRGLWLALFAGCALSGIVLFLLQFFFLPFILIGTGGAVIAALIAGWVIFKSQQSLLHSMTRWRPPFAVIALSAVPGLAVGFFAIRSGLGLATAAIPGCAVQALALRLVAPSQAAETPPDASNPASSVH